MDCPTTEEAPVAGGPQGCSRSARSPRSGCHAVRVCRAKTGPAHASAPELRLSAGTPPSPVPAVPGRAGRAVCLLCTAGGLGHAPLRWACSPGPRGQRAQRVRALGSGRASLSPCGRDRAICSGRHSALPKPECFQHLKTEELPGLCQPPCPLPKCVFLTSLKAANGTIWYQRPHGPSRPVQAGTEWGPLACEGDVGGHSHVRGHAVPNDLLCPSSYFVAPGGPELETLHVTLVAGEGLGLGPNLKGSDPGLAIGAGFP